MLINLCNINYIDSNYDNIFDFSSKANQTSFFNSNVITTIESNVRNDDSRTIININKKIETINNCNYLFFEENNIRFYYFIMSKEKKGNTTDLILKLDVYQTYQFDFEFMECFINRCHVNRWIGDIPTKNNLDEGINPKNIIEESSKVIKTYSDNFVIVSTTPLGKLETGTGGGVEPEEPQEPNPTDHMTHNNELGNGWILPVKNGIITSLYGLRKDPFTGVETFHKGTDIGCSEGTNILACDDGIVLANSFESNGFGNYLLIRHRGNIDVYYPHMRDKGLPNVNSTVKKGDLVGYVGSTGASSGSHFHYQMQVGTKTYDPLPGFQLNQPV